MACISSVRGPHIWCAHPQLSTPCCKHSPHQKRRSLFSRRIISSIASNAASSTTWTTLNSRSRAVIIAFRLARSTLTSIGATSNSVYRWSTETFFLEPTRPLAGASRWLGKRDCSGTRTCWSSSAWLMSPYSPARFLFGEYATRHGPDLLQEAIPHSFSFRTRLYPSTGSHPRRAVTMDSPLAAGIITHFQLWLFQIWQKGRDFSPLFWLTRTRGECAGALLRRRPPIRWWSIVCFMEWGNR